jgi:hypothetical protein
LVHVCETGVEPPSLGGDPPFPLPPAPPVDVEFPPEFAPPVSAPAAPLPFAAPPLDAPPLDAPDAPDAPPPEALPAPPSIGDVASTTVSPQPDSAPMHIAISVVL